MSSALIIVMNLPVPEDRRIWLQAKALRAAGWDVEVICPALHNHHVGRRQIDDITVTYYRAFDAKSNAGLVVEVICDVVKISWLYWRRRRAIDLVQVANPLDVLPHVLVDARRRGIATVYDQHDVVPELAAMRPVLRRAARLFVWLEGATVRASTLVITSSSEQARRLGLLYGTSARVVRTAGFEGRPDALRSTESAAPTSIVLGYLGVIGVQDAVEDAVRVFARLEGSHPEARLLIGGDGPAAGSVRQLVESLGMQRKVEMRGWINSDGVQDFLGQVDIMLVPDHPSSFNDLCAMNKVTHAMSLGLPIVMRPLKENVRVTGGHAVVAEGPSLEHFQDALTRALTLTPSERSALGRAGRVHYMAEHSWSEHAKRYLSYIEEARSALIGRVRRHT